MLLKLIVQKGTHCFFGEPNCFANEKKLNTIPYEVLTSISQRVKRVFYR
jgi:alanine racemase